MPHPAPITIVSGLPRSGTSLAMQMLVAGGLTPMSDGQRVADPDNPRGYLEFERVKQLATDTSWLPDAAGRVVKVIHMLVPLLPDDHEYRVIFMERDMVEVTRSQATMLQRSGRTGATLSANALANVYSQQLAAVQAHLATRPHFRVLRVPYAQLVAAPADWVHTINQHLGGHLDESLMVDAVDPSLYRNRA